MTSTLTKYVKSWIEKAENDLMTAQRLLEISPMILDNACFHCQQAAEKFLKGFLVYKGYDLERTHDIVFLLAKCAAFDPIFTTLDPLNLNAYAVQSRYPDSNLMPTESEATAYYQLAVEIKSLILNRIYIG